ncbi:Guanine nucleotide-binding protein subunit alpha [Grifola frondosa]|uniref:Guanine nucleotide-binding protein subunit alpha n=1 Tax=Grifola frondosa TaxID=5627 RepID=A0A1C7MMZ9_GRIFR|nr:Guanine nucleotide-binding protein subunit alpha [Grifola frondosa]
MRLEEEREAKKVSDAIDRAIELERQGLKRRGHTKLLLLGQAESGKSTMLKNFQLNFTPKALQAENEGWRAVIYLNLIHSVNFIIDLLSNPASNDIRRYKLSLSPLRQVEVILVKQLSSSDPPHSRADTDNTTDYRRVSEVSIRGGSGWKALLRLHTQPPPPKASDLENARQILDACKDDIIALWADAMVQARLLEEGMILQEQSGFFLDQAHRVASFDYEPTFDDILRARLQTIGVEEHRLIMETSAEQGQQWIFYDVGGARGQRAAWVPFFDDVNAVLFLCSMAGFNEVLVEDRTVNRLLDSFNLWKTICSSHTRLKAGISFSSFVKSYKDAPNDLEHVTDYLKRKFVAKYQSDSLKPPRQLHVHITCAIDIATTSAVLARIRDTVLVNNLLATDML